MFNIDHYINCVLEMNIEQLTEEELKCRECFWILSRKYSLSEMKKKLNLVIFSDCEKMYFYGPDETLWENICDELICDSNIERDLTTISISSREELEDELDLEISISDGCDKDIVIIYDDDCTFYEYRDKFLRMEQDTFDDWEEKMSQPMKARILTIEEIEELSKGDLL